MGKSMEKLRSSRSPMEEKEEHFSIFARTELLEEGENCWKRKGRV
jgi:hypothetical protein